MNTEADRHRLFISAINRLIDKSAKEARIYPNKKIIGESWRKKEVEPGRVPALPKKM